MIRFVACAAVGALVVSLAVHHSRTTPAQVAESAPPAKMIATSPLPSPKPVSRREQMARLVAETAAIAADRTVRRILAERAGVQETASR